MSELSIVTKVVVLLGRLLAIAIILSAFIVSFFHGMPSNIAVTIFLLIAMLGLVCVFTPLPRIGFKNYLVLYSLLLNIYRCSFVGDMKKHNKSIKITRATRGLGRRKKRGAPYLKRYVSGGNHGRKNSQKE